MTLIGYVISKLYIAHKVLNLKAFMGCQVTFFTYILQTTLDLTDYFEFDLSWQRCFSLLDLKTRHHLSDPRPTYVMGETRDHLDFKAQEQFFKFVVSFLKVCNCRCCNYYFYFLKKAGYPCAIAHMSRSWHNVVIHFALKRHTLRW